MLIAIDDTYGPENIPPTRYVTGSRRTSLGVAVPENEADEIRQFIRNGLTLIRDEAGIQAEEFHFTDIFNRQGPWEVIKDSSNIALIEIFVNLYNKNKWPVFIQTIDRRTLNDHGIKLVGKAGKINLENWAHLAFVFLLTKIKDFILEINEPAVIYVDEGLYKAGSQLSDEYFKNWPTEVKCHFESSAIEPIIQIADFLAFAINRSTYLATKPKKTEFDLEMLSLFGSIEINCKDISRVSASRNFSAESLDRFHDRDRKKKGLPKIP